MTALRATLLSGTVAILFIGPTVIWNVGYNAALEQCDLQRAEEWRDESAFRAKAKAELGCKEDGELIPVLRCGEATWTGGLRYEQWDGSWVKIGETEHERMCRQVREWEAEPIQEKFRYRLRPGTCIYPFSEPWPGIFPVRSTLFNKPPPFGSHWDSDSCANATDPWKHLDELRRLTLLPSCMPDEHGILRNYPEVK